MWALETELRWALWFSPFLLTIELLPQPLFLPCSDDILFHDSYVKMWKICVSARHWPESPWTYLIMSLFHFLARSQYLCLIFYKQSIVGLCTIHICTFFSFNSTSSFFLESLIPWWMLIFILQLYMHPRYIIIPLTLWGKLDMDS